jgi:DNA-binding response OmpR family regulator
MIPTAHPNGLLVSPKRIIGELTINTRIPNVLVIAKDDTVGIMIAGALEGAGFTVTSASDGMEGLEKLLKSYIDIIVMDGTLPDVYGGDARIRIRQASNLPIIVIGENHDVAESLELGADAFMPRPPILRELVARVRNLLNRTPDFVYRNSEIIRNTNKKHYNPFFPNDGPYFLGM